jgi:hypothetical protein
MNKKDDFDFPDQPVEPIAPVPVLPAVQEFTLASSTVKPYDHSAWVREHGPKPPTAGMQAMDFAIVGMMDGTIILVVKTWGWILFS